MVGVHVFEDRSRGVGGRLGDNVDVARALACARAYLTVSSQYRQNFIFTNQSVLLHHLLNLFRIVLDLVVLHNHGI